MNNSLFDLIKLINMMNQSQGQQTQQHNPSFNYYPSEAFPRAQAQSTSLQNDNNILPLLMSMLNKNTDLSKIFTNTPQKKENEEIKKESTSPTDEILL